mmetsp:Transcript_27343/g.63056  ORF Transcript_27343/g.63056 Transcript_27343/m.63056 type:complete len:683 (-) Transcript_27343:121-2169(-)
MASACGLSATRQAALHSAAEAKRGSLPVQYYHDLVTTSERWFANGDTEAMQELKQMRKDLNRTFQNILPPSQTSPGTSICSEWLDKLEHVLRAQIVRSQRRTLYTQGMNFLAGMCLLLVHEECSAFWLYCKVLEDILDPDFFATRPVPLVGYQAMQTVIKLYARDLGCCARLIGDFGSEFDNLTDMLLVHWLFQGFVNCLPTRLLRLLWQELLSEIGITEERSVPEATAGLVSIALAILSYCGEARFESQGPNQDELRVHAVYQDILNVARHLPENEDQAFLACVREIARKIDADVLHEELRLEKKRLVDPTFLGQAEPSTSTLQQLVQASHFTAQELEKMHDEFKRVCEGRDGCDLETFKAVLRPFSSGFPVDLCCKELFQRLDRFGSGRLSFAELLAGTSVLLRGGVDEKVRMMFNIFDSDRVDSLGLRGILRLCDVVFRLALKNSAMEQQTCRSEVSGSFSARLLSFSSESSRAEEDIVSNAGDDTPLDRRPQRLSVDATPTGAGALKRSLSEETFQELQAACEELEELRLAGAAEEREATKASLLRRTSRRGTSTSRTSLGSLAESCQPGRLKSQWTLAGIHSGSRSLLLKLLLVAEKHPAGMRVPYDGFRRAIITEVQILMLFSWCLPEPPDVVSRREVSQLSPWSEQRVLSSCTSRSARCCQKFRQACSSSGCTIL